MDNIKQQLADIFMDTLPDEHPWEGRVCDLVDALIANNVTVQEWIPVAERLPKVGEDVLVIQNNSDRNMAVWRLFHLIAEIPPHWEDEVGDGRILEAVTHWMPLPQPPKQEG